MEFCFRKVAFYVSSSLFCLELALFVVVFKHSATTALREVAQHQKTILAENKDMSPSSSALAAAASRTTTTVVGNPRDEESWLCRISKGYAACGLREYDGLHPPRKNMYCPDGFCCSKTACFGSCGSWCHDSWALCSTSIVYHTEFSYGNCSCKRFGHECHADADCVHKNEENGGTYCQCRTGYVGNGRNCLRDYCTGNPCYPGECTNTAYAYTCICPNTHKLERVNDREVCTEKTDFCRFRPCGPDYMVERCTNKDDGFDCECKEGYNVRNGRCEEIDLCADSPCGPPEAVHSCTMERTPRLRYRCLCKNGFETRVLPDGLSEVCRKDWCNNNPCGDPERVKDCSSTENGYSCLCKATYVVETDAEGKEKCVKGDVCKNNPCGPPHRARQCYAQGASYRCDCQPGYFEFEEGGHKYCKEGDPCLLDACGSEEKVLKCSTSGSNYTCVCREPDFLLGMEDGHKVCLSKSECVKNCGPLEAVSMCAISDGSYVCKCNDGFVTVYSGGRRMCEQQDVCALSPCGSEEAVEACTANSTGSSSPHKCTCKAGYEVRNLEDGSEVCAEESSCVGNPCGPPDIVKACIAEEKGYSCRCADNFEQAMPGGKKRCVPARSEAYEEKSRTEAEGMSNAAIAGSVLGGLVLIGSVGAGIAYSKRNDEGEEDETAEDDAVPPMPSPLGIPPGPPTGSISIPTPAY